MGLDGMSMGQINQNKELPSNLLALEADTVASMKKGDMIVTFDQVSKASQVDRREDNYGEDVENSIPGGHTESHQEVKDSELEDLSEDDENSYTKRYILKINDDSGQIELFDNEIQQIVDVIDEKNLLEIFSKLNYASGLIITKKV